MVHAGADEVRGIVAELLDCAERGQANGWLSIEAILREWRRLDADCRVVVVDSARLWLAGWLLTEAASAEADRASLAYQIAADIVVERDGSSGVMRAVADSPELIGALDRVIAAGAREYPAHRNQAVLEALVAMAHAPGPAVRELLSDPTQAVHLSLRSLARRRADTLASARLVAWLALPALAPIARGALEAALAAGDEGALRTSHLLLARSRAVEARRIAGLDRLLGDRAAVTALSVEARRGLIRWLGFASAKRERVLSFLGGLVADSSPLVRLDAVRALARMRPTPESDLILQEFSADSVEPVAGTAVAALASAASAARRRSLRGFLETLGGSPHESVRRLARRGGETRRHEGLAGLTAGGVRS
ncbi:MAG: hypothetical protein JNK58_10210 [Phycisphaerae bacterium]|nr:hypothetical protein [Phycisphaerae bacterium]